VGACGDESDTLFRVFRFYLFKTDAGLRHSSPHW
jgi:hypothetical protein